ncbi:hypothetical protein L202_05530 [Cryptococcus amylolentus CBS 6039]|uniref:Uncharacterized protein n=2 Tax=Cryptococcus amylolentus TaxID=104669 RepID=A0A1E3HKS8_9TREE|nr:hypothetical protein L202_05530 [Cryptococcus amylolentus CBS 6039]ODN76967.1 hypothetical protein L202_05530 [Cryptococcus amylolentus CBS 6039]ODO04848.1 hypothetical protein I350_05458 [Cryptococcus amylolentus CBS 6273]
MASSMTTQPTTAASRAKRLSTSATPSLVKRGSVIMMGEGAEDGDVSMEKEKINDGLNKTNNSLRIRISELETLIEQATGPEVERLSEEVLTLEELDNEAKLTENEKQKQYVKDLENLLGTLAGPSWRIDHQLSAPSAPTTNICSASTPLPKPKPKQLSSSLRHSVSFSSGPPASRLHRRANSTMDLGSMMASVGAGAGLGAVEEIRESGGQDSTPTGALRRLNGGRSVSARPDTSTTKELERVPSSAPVSHKRAAEHIFDKDNGYVNELVDTEQLSKVLRLLSTIDPNTISSLVGRELQDRNRPGRGETNEVTKGDKDRSILEKMFEEQERRLAAREERLDRLVQTVRIREARYDRRV